MNSAVGWITQQRWSYPLSTESIAVARADVATFVSGSDHAHRVDDVRLMVSELVTNAIIHGHSTATMNACSNAALLRVEVADSSHHGAKAQAPALSEPDGRGLMIVTALADAWGVVQQAAGKTVWFEVRA